MELNQLSDELAAKLEKEHVHLVYDDIANHFSHTRHTAWPEVARFVSTLHCTDRLLDIGCGNGKNLLIASQQVQNNQVSLDLQSCVRLATDMSFGLLSVCRERGLPSVQANCLQLPFLENTFDALICIAVLHHLVTERRRMQALTEISRVLLSNGKALIYVWAFEQKRNGKKSVYITKKTDSNEDESTGQIQCQQTVAGQLPVHQNRTAFQQQDMLVPWNSKNFKKSADQKEEKSVEQLRFYHLFKEGELEQLIDKIDNLQIVRSYFDNGNWAVIVRKK